MRGAPTTPLRRVLTSTDAIIIDGSTRGFSSQKPALATLTVRTSFDDAFRKENDADRATAISPEQEAGQARYPSK